MSSLTGVSTIDSDVFCPRFLRSSAYKVKWRDLVWRTLLEEVILRLTVSPLKK